MLSDKYIAGFLDADGSIQVFFRPLDRANSNPAIQRAYIGLEFTQRQDRDAVLYMLQNTIGGEITERNSVFGSTLKLFGKKAIMVLNRIKKHLVIKRHYADFCLSIANQIVAKKEMQERLRQERMIKSLPLPNFPSRKWMAGYIDGDGCFSVRFDNGRKSGQPVLEIVASDYDSEGIELIGKVFGGSIHHADNNRKHIVKLTLIMPPSKTKQLFEYCGKYFVIKKTQTDFLMGCAEMGHYHDGERIKAIMKQLKAHPHRLNEPKPDVASLLSQVRDISFKETYKRRNYWPTERR